MYRRKDRNQVSFEDFFLPFGGNLSGENRWIKLADLIPWYELEDDYAAQFCKGVWSSSQAIPNGAKWGFLNKTRSIAPQWI